MTDTPALPVPYYEDDWVTLYCGDALEVMASLPDGCVDTVLTDPPYSSGGRRENARSLRRSMTRSVEDDDWIRGDSMSTVGYVWFNRLAALQWRRLLIPGGHALAFVDWRMETHLAGALEAADLRQHPTLVWDKKHFGMGAIFRNQHEMIVHCSAGNPRPPFRRDVGNVVQCAPVRSETHPNEKPVGLLRTLLTVVAAPAGTVLDCLAGSGSTPLAARSLGMRSIGIEAEEKHCAEIVAALAQKPLPVLVDPRVAEYEPLTLDVAS